VQLQHLRLFVSHILVGNLFDAQCERNEMTYLDTNAIAKPSGIREFFQGVSATLARMHNSMQVGRMTSILLQMSDQELENIGVKRSEIPQHADKMINGPFSET
jgi:uncharacterized protein YjiS (DUF1127 family)